MDWLFRYAMVIRVPLTFAGLMLLLSVLDRFTGPWQMLRGLFVLGRWETGLVTFVTVTTAWVIVSTAETAWIAARPRQLVPRRSAWVSARKMPWLDRWVGHPPMPRFWLWRFAAVAVVAAPVIFAVRRTTELDFSIARYPKTSFNFAIAGGIAVFLALYVVVAVAFGSLDRWLTAVTAAPEKRETHWLRFGRVVTRVIGGGYFRHDGVILPGPMFALVQFASFLVVYVAMGRLFRPDRLGADGCLTTNAYGWECLPPLASLMLVIAVLCLLLTGLTFLLDRWRIPTLAVLVGMMAIGQFYADVDHTFTLKPHSIGRIEVTPADVVDTVMSSTSDRR
ncbi:MAG TPA: hypothetical protein PKE20_07635, partial [Promineifilum sp.]|nr:hypothetical protein [Promineifilum sp.]